MSSDVCTRIGLFLDREPRAGKSSSGLANQVEAGAGRGAWPGLPPRRVRGQPLPPAPHLLEHPRGRQRQRARLGLRAPPAARAGATGGDPAEAGRAQLRRYPAGDPYGPVARGRRRRGSDAVGAHGGAGGVDVRGVRRGAAAEQGRRGRDGGAPAGDAALRGPRPEGAAQYGGGGEDDRGHQGKGEQASQVLRVAVASRALVRVLSLRVRGHHKVHSRLKFLIQFVVSTFVSFFLFR
uniref:Uncharacterized protein n=1 Tax=Arundo donax TaxID=35708 RepID=A0A0A8ZB77_ARUDO